MRFILPGAEIRLWRNRQLSSFLLEGVLFAVAYPNRTNRIYMKRIWHYASRELGLWPAVASIFNTANIACLSASAWPWLLPCLFVAPLILSLWQAERSYRGATVNQGRSLILNSRIQALSFVMGCATLVIQPCICTLCGIFCRGHSLFCGFRISCGPTCQRHGEHTPRRT